MNIFISADDRFILPTKVMLTSFFENNRSDHHDIYFLYSDVQTESLEKLNSLAESYGGYFHPVLIQEKDFQGFKCKNQYPLLVYFRLLVAQLLPQTEDRALWMDVDLVVNGSLDEFYYQDFDGASLVACRDCDSPGRMGDLGCPPGSIYFNAGVVLFNAKVMRKYSLADYYEYYSKHEEHVMMQDQDILNGMFSGTAKIWKDNFYNYYAPSGSTKSEFNFQLVKKQVKIVHYIGKCKPWMNTYAHPLGELWDDYFLCSPEGKRIDAKQYKGKHCCMRFFQRHFILPLRIIHGKLHDRFSKVK